MRRDKSGYRRNRKIFALGLAMLLFAAIFAGCGEEGEEARPDPFAEGHAVVDVSGYESMADYEGHVAFMETDVKEVAELMESEETFVLYAAFADCPYCNRMTPYLNEAALENGWTVGYIDTRKNPEWSSNMDIDDYDLFVELFGEYLDEDENGDLHLYTPDLYFVKKGEVVAHHPGVVEGADDASVPLTEEQEKALRENLAEEFSLLL